MTRITSRGHLYASTQRNVIRVPAVIALFAIAYALLVFALGIVPLNLLLARLLRASEMPAIWLDSFARLGERTATATIACWLTLLVARRGRGRLSGRGMLALGAAVSGALAGAVDVGLHHLWTGRLIKAAHTSRMGGITLSLAITAGVSIVVTLLMIVRSMRTLPHEQ